MRLVGVKSGADHTRRMRAFARRACEALAKEDLDGYILKKDSPSCGMERVKVYDPNGMPGAHGRGLFAEALIERLPLLPVEEEGRLSRSRGCARTSSSASSRTAACGCCSPARWTVGALVQFHTAHKLTLLAHSPSAYQRSAASWRARRRCPAPSVREQYREAFMARAGDDGDAAAARQRAAAHARVLPRPLDASRGQELAGAIADYQQRAWCRWSCRSRCCVTTCGAGRRVPGGQVYLEPHPKELMLRNHV